MNSTRIDAETARAITIRGISERKAEELKLALRHISEQAKFGATGVLHHTTYDISPETISELNRRGFAVAVCPTRKSEVYISWGIKGIKPLWIPEWLSVESLK